MYSSKEPSPGGHRRTRPTLRNLQEDLGLPILPLSESLEEIKSDLLEELRRLAPSSPVGQKRILSIKKPPVYSFKVGGMRGASWVEESLLIVWMLGAERREEGSRQDAYKYFAGLSRRGRLLPTSDDYLRDRAETATRFLSVIEGTLPRLARQAEGAIGTEIASTIEGVDVLLLMQDREISEKSGWPWASEYRKGSETPSSFTWRDCFLDLLGSGEQTGQLGN